MYIVMCRCSGGVTGTRQAPLKENGNIKWFGSFKEADDEAKRLTQQMNGNPYRTADFKYWAQDES